MDEITVALARSVARLEIALTETEARLEAARSVSAADDAREAAASVEDRARGRSDAARALLAKAREFKSDVSASRDRTRTNRRIAEALEEIAGDLIG